MRFYHRHMLPSLATSRRSSINTGYLFAITLNAVIYENKLIEYTPLLSARFWDGKETKWKPVPHMSLQSLYPQIIVIISRRVMWSHTRSLAAIIHRHRPADRSTWSIQIGLTQPDHKTMTTTNRLDNEIFGKPNIKLQYEWPIEP